MLVIHKNNITLDTLDAHSRELLDQSGDNAVIEILDGDESLQRSLGEVWQLSDLATFVSGDRLVSSYVDESLIPFPFEKRKGYYFGEWIYECDRPVGRQAGFSPVNGTTMRQKTIKVSLPDGDMDWLESQPNQSATIREAIAQLRRNSTQS